MANKRMPWLKLYTEMLDDPKMADLTDAQRWHWVAVLLMARESDTPGLIPLTVTQMRWRLRADSSFADTIEALCQMNLIVAEEEGYRVVRFVERQARKPSDKPEEVKKRVDLHRSKARNAPVTRYTDDCNAMKRALEGEGEEIREEETPPNPPQAGEAPDGAAVDSSPYPAAFEAFWQAYPNKKAKGYALKAWQRIKGRPPVEELVAAVERAKGSDGWRKENGAFIPHPATWLNGRRWEDEFPVNSIGPVEPNGAADSAPLMSPEQCEAAQRQRKADREAQLQRLYGAKAVNATKAAYS